MSTSTPTSPDAIARTLAEHFAPELGATLPRFTERLLAGESTDEPIMRSGSSSTLGFASYLVRLSMLAIELDHRLTVERGNQGFSSKLSILDAMLTGLRREAPHDHRVPEHMRERMVTAVVDVTLGRTRLLPHTTILTLHRATVSAGFRDRRALLSGIDKTFVDGLHTTPSYADQLLCDLDALNHAGALADGSLPLATWLDNAVTLAGLRREAQEFADARAQLNAT